MTYRHLFSELKIGPMTLKNRIAMPAMHLHYDDAGEVTDRLVEFYAARAEGGAGFIVVGGCSIDTPGGGAMMPGLYDDAFVPGLKRLADAVKAHGARVGAQLFHAGRYSYSFLFGIDPIAPSPIASKLTRQVPHEMTRDEIASLVRAFGDGAERAVAAGFDAVEVIGSAGYLLCQFLSPIANARTDEYGGSLENRMRFPREVMREVRRRIGGGVALTVRVAGNEFMGDHARRDEVFSVTRMYEEEGADALSVTGGWHESLVPQITGHLPAAGYAYLARDIRERAKIPVFASNRLGRPELAEEMLRRGFADGINMARPLLADPDVPRKAKGGREREIRPCIGCNQECLDNVFKALPTACTVNPAASRERECKLEATSRKKKVAVVGGGPAGCETARTAALRGHDVTLFERHPSRLGGQLHDACAAPGKDPYSELAAFHQAELRRLGVDVRLGRSASVESLRAGGFDAVIVAAGSSQIRPPVPGIDLPHVVLARDVLEGLHDWTDDVVIVGAGGVGLDTAHVIADRDTIDGRMVKFLLDNDAEPVETIRRLSTRARRRITVIDMLERPGADIGRSTKWIILQELKRLGVAIMVSARLKAVHPDRVEVEVDGAVKEIPATTVIIAAGARPNADLFEKCKGVFAEVHLVGDASSPRNITTAIREGFEAGRTV
ncbi:MAG: FAD-dependent oxidoreductase [Deltaproteobacteria bacterium]|nr:FAD-dependent oxidoreductase [Deltaproteobacteria bacterium]